MSQDHRLQQQRFELKYLVPESVACQMRDFVASHLEPDEYGVEQPDLAYQIHSLYLDSDDLSTHQDYLNGTKNRYKLRLRYYDDRPGSPVFFEVKARVDNCILKRRCAVRRDAVPGVLAGRLPNADQLITTEARHIAALERFIVLMQSINARPKAHNTYRREAWVNPHDNSVRVTFDRHIRIEPCFRCDLSTTMRDPVPVYSPTVVLELKFTDRFPNWFVDLAECFNLMQSSSAKYSGGVLLLGEAQFDAGMGFAAAPFAPSIPAARAEDLILVEAEA